MGNFFEFFLDFATIIINGVVQIFGGIFGGILSLFNIPKFVSTFTIHCPAFNTLDWVFAIVSIIVIIAIYVLVGYILFLLIRKYIRFRKSIVQQEDLLEELAYLHREVIKLSNEKEKILSMKVSQIGLNSGESNIADDNNEENRNIVNSNEQRFYKLATVDEKYLEYTPPLYNNELNLEQICKTFRNFACSRMNLYYDINIIRLLLAGMGSTKMILLQGISGTGKTSLPYAMGKFLETDAVVASVQPSWRDRTELFGYFNEFTKKFNETEVLKKIYECSYNDDINIIILDEMNIARVEYYFAEMLSVLEMPDKNEWKIDLVPSSWSSDPKKLEDGKLQIPSNLWFVGTANNDDSTFAVSDKVYDRALPINLDSKGIEFDAPDTPPIQLSYANLEQQFKTAIETYPVSKENLTKVTKLDIYVIEKLRIAFGNRILKQMYDFVPIFVACGGTEIDGIDYILSNKIFRKFESLNLSFIRDELDGLIVFMDKTFGKTHMKESKAYIERLKRMY